MKQVIIPNPHLEKDFFIALKLVAREVELDNGADVKHSFSQGRIKKQVVDTDNGS